MPLFASLPAHRDANGARSTVSTAGGPAPNRAGLDVLQSTAGGGAGEPWLAANGAVAKQATTCAVSGLDVPSALGATGRFSVPPSKVASDGTALRSSFR